MSAVAGSATCGDQDAWAFAKNLSHDLYEVLLHVQDDGLSLQKWIQRRIDASGVAKSDIVRLSHLDRVYAYQLMSGTRHGTRNKLIMLARGMQLNIEETSELLERAGLCPLRPQSRRDATIAFCIARNKTVPQCDEVLFRADMDTLRPNYGKDE